jgi:hypothetical protein
MTDLETIRRVNAQVDQKRLYRNHAQFELEEHVSQCEFCSDTLDGELCHTGSRLRKDYIDANAALRGF